MASEKKKYVTNEQKLALVDYVESNPKLLKCKFDSQFIFKDSNKLWEDVSTTLNEMAGAKKNSKEWKKRWNDLRRNTKEKAAKVRKHMNGTGGGPVLDDDFTDMQEKVINLIGPTVIEGHSNVIESNVLINLIEQEKNEISFAEPNEFDKDKNDSSFIVVNEFDNDKNIEGLIVPNESNKIYGDCNIRTPITDSVAKEKKRKIQATARFEKSAYAVEGLCSVAERKLELKKTYYERKLTLLDRQIEAVERQSTVQEEGLRILKIHFGMGN